MENFKRINKNSFLYFIEQKFDFNDLDQGGEGQAFENNEYIILQIWLNPICPHDENSIAGIIEYIKREGQGIGEGKTELKPDLDFENYLETYINRDPFGGKYSGKMIKEVFDAGDKRWLDTALKEMKNEFIRERLQYIIDRGGYGKINS